MDTALNWLWQGLVVAAATSALLFLIPRTRPQARYRLIWVAIVFTCALPIIALATAVAQPTVAVAALAPAAAPVVSLPSAWWTSDAAAGAVWGIWIAAALAGSLRAVVALAAATRRSRPLGARDEARLAHWHRVRSRGRVARLGVSTAVPAAAVFAGRPPIIAIAPALIAELSDDDLDRIVIHEWAHVQRRDDVSVIAELVVRVLAGWHPAIWWLQRQLHAEREAACDDLAVSVTGSARAYAGCLAMLAERRLTQLPQIPVVGAIARSGLRDRVARVLAPRRAVSAWGRWTLTSASVVPGALAIALAHVPIVDAAAVVSEVRRLDDLALEGSATRPAAVADPTPVGFGAPDRSSEQGIAPPPRFGAGSGHPLVPAPPTSSPAPPPSIADAPLPAVEDASLPVIASTPTVSFDAPLQPTPVDPIPSGAGPSTTPNHSEPPTLWGAAAEGGTAVGRGSQKAAVATAGFFTRVSKKIAGSF